MVTVRRAMGRVRGPDELGAEERAWNVVRAAYGDNPVVVARRSRWRMAAVPAIVALVAGVALSPAGATVSRLIREALGVQHAARALFSLPAPGRLLVSGPGTTWMVSADGSSRRLGAFSQASWSPRGLYIAAEQNDRLMAVDPHGTIRWALARPAVSDATWYYPSGYRVAYLSGRQLRVVAGDGTGDRLLSDHVAPVAPAWWPNHAYDLAYVDSRGVLTVRHAETGHLIWTADTGVVRKLQWSADGSSLLVLGPSRAAVYDSRGYLQARINAGAPVLDGALSPDGRTLALVRGGYAHDVVLVDLDHPRPALRPVLTGDGVRQAVWAPDGRWLLVSWPAANQWVFIRTTASPRIIAVSRIAQQFPSGSSGRAFPTLHGWCCTVSSGTG